MDQLIRIIPPREKDLGGFFVRRLLPYAAQRMVGPYIFFDHMGPATFPPGKGISVRPHPHIHLATVTYLFCGKILHRDSLGSEQIIEPGAMNWMTAGRGIVHSERCPPDLLRAGSSLNGIQLWVALPKESENVAPTFIHHPATAFPEFSIGKVMARLLLGSAFERHSPVIVHSPILYMDVNMPAGSHLRIPALYPEIGVYVADGAVQVGGSTVNTYHLAVGKANASLDIEAKAESRLMLLGGTPLGPRHIEWNFVSSDPEQIRQAKKDWNKGPGAAGSRFPRVPGDEMEFIPLPDETDSSED